MSIQPHVLTLHSRSIAEQCGAEGYGGRGGVGLGVVTFYKYRHISRLLFFSFELRSIDAELRYSRTCTA
jgi:hypothetical protein